MANILCMIFGHQLSIGQQWVHNDQRLAIRCTFCGFYDLHGDQIHSPQEQYAMNTGQMRRGYRSLPRKPVAKLLASYVLEGQASLPDDKRMSAENAQALLALADSNPEEVIRMLNR